jgi:hypothetical protein
MTEEIVVRADISKNMIDLACKLCGTRELVYGNFIDEDGVLTDEYEFVILGLIGKHKKCLPE